MQGDPEGIIGTVNRNGWKNSEIFLDVLKEMKENPIILHPGKWHNLFVISTTHVSQASTLSFQSIGF